MEISRAIRHAERIAARVLLRRMRSELGFPRAAAVLARVAWWKAKGEPFIDLGPPKDHRDRLSRRQCADLILLDRALRATASSEVALSLVRTAVLAGAPPFLEAMIPDLTPLGLADEAGGLAERFFNAEGEARLVDDHHFHFEVRRCRFVELLAHARATHLGPLFCEADLAFFDGAHRPITLRRTRTLASGGASCDFHFTLR
jgi:hypothetical protein